MLGLITRSKKKYEIMSLVYYKDFVKSLVTVTRLIKITVEFQSHHLVLILSNIDTFHHASIMTSVMFVRDILQ